MNRDMKDNNQFENQVRHKIAGWYSDKQYEDKAVARICNVRNQIIGLLQSTGRDGIDNVIEYLDNSGFYYRASSSHGHHNFPGGLSEHCLGTYLLAKKDPKAKNLPEDRVIIGALLHDICKADRFWFKGRSINEHHPKCEMDGRHSVRSIAILKDCGLKLNDDERLAIRWHMRGSNYYPKDLKKRQDHEAVQKCRGRGAFKIVADRKRNQRKKGKHPEFAEKCLDDFDLQGKDQGDDFNRPDTVNPLGNMLSDDGKVTDSV